MEQVVRASITATSSRVRCAFAYMYSVDLWVLSDNVRRGGIVAEMLLYG